MAGNSIALNFDGVPIRSGQGDYINTAGYEIGFGEYGDSKHFYRRKNTIT